MKWSLPIALALLLLTALQFQNCSSYSDPSPFDIGANNLASTSAPSDIRLDSPSGPLDIPVTGRQISMGGDCNVGLSANHFIEIRLTDSQNQPVPVREDPVSCPKGSNQVSADCFINRAFKCEHGHYYLNLPLNCAAYRGQAQSVYKLSGQMVTMDSAGTQTRDNKASFERYFSIFWNPGDCP